MCSTEVEMHLISCVSRSQLCNNKCTELWIKSLTLSKAFMFLARDFTFTFRVLIHFSTQEGKGAFEEGG